MNRFTNISPTTSDRTKINATGKIAIEIFATLNNERNISLIEKATRNENNILRYVAWDVNRFSAQDMIKEVINEGVEPMIEEILSN